MVKLNLEHILILAVAVFLLYHFVGRCNCFNGNSFSVGGQKQAVNQLKTCDDQYRKLYMNLMMNLSSDADNLSKDKIIDVINNNEGYKFQRNLLKYSCNINKIEELCDLRSSANEEDNRILEGMCDAILNYKKN